MASISSKVCAAFLFVSVLACGSKTENKVKPLAGAGAAGNNTAAVANDPTKTPAEDPNAKKDPAGTANPTAAPAGDAMKYVYENANILVSIDVKKLLASPFMENPALKAEIEKLKSDEEFKKALAAGIDPFTNVDKLIVSGDATKDSFAVVVTGTFDAAKVGEAIKAEIAKEASGKGVVEVIGSNTLIIADKAEDLDAAKSGKGVEGSPMLKEAMAMADATRAIFVVAQIPAEAAAMAKDAPIPGLTSAKNATFGLNVDKGLDMVVTVQFGSDADATSVKTGLDQMLPMGAAMGVPQDVMSALKLEAAGANLKISLVLDEAQLKKLEEMAKQMGGMAPMPGMDMPMPDEKK
jgi:ABC-type molybdate transport system substrate-binding protein